MAFGACFRPSEEAIPDLKSCECSLETEVMEGEGAVKELGIHAGI